MGNSRKVAQSAYPIPSDLLPENDFCAKVYIPDGDDYRRAFLGAYMFFGTWVAWERDNGHNATIAAARFRDAIEKTIEGWGELCNCTDCEFLDMTEDEFRQFFAEELEKMTVTVTQTVNCGCCGDSTTSSTVTDDNPPDGYVPPIVPVEDPVDYVQPTEKCDRVTYLLVSYRNMLLSLTQSVEGNYDGFVSWFDGVIGWVTGVLPVSYEVYLRIKGWLLSGTNDETNAIISSYDPNFDAMVCSMFSATSASEAKGAVGSILASYVWGELSPFMKLAAMEIFEQLPFGILFDASTVVDIPPGYTNRSCCGSVPIDTDIGLWIYDASNSEPGYNGSSSVDWLWNQVSQFDADVILYKTVSTDSYNFYIERPCSLSDATSFVVNVGQSGNTREWSLQFRSASDAVLLSVPIVNQSAPQTLSVTSGDVDFTLVETVRFTRLSEIYTASNPRMFGIDAEINTDSLEWLVY